MMMMKKKKEEELVRGYLYRERERETFVLDKAVCKNVTMCGGPL